MAYTNKKIALSLVTAALFGTILFAQPGGMSNCPMNDKSGGPGMMSPNAIFMELDLSDAQKQQFQALQEESQKLRSQMRKSRKNNMAMSQYVNEKGFDKQKFIDEQTKDMAARIALRAENFEKRYNILNAEQKVELVKILKEHDERMANKMENMDYMMKKQKRMNQ